MVVFLDDIFGGLLGKKERGRKKKSVFFGGQQKGETINDETFRMGVFFGDGSFWKIWEQTMKPHPQHHCVHRVN